MSEWRRVKVKDVCCLIVDCVNRTAPVVDYETHYRMIRTTNIRNGRIDLSNCRYVDETTFKKWTRRAVVNNGDVILTREAPIGEVGYVKDIGCVFLGQRTMQYRADPDKIDSRYLFFAFRSPDLQYQFGSHDGSGSVVSHIRVADCHEFMVPLPPKKEQVAISELLGALDDKIDLNRRMNETLEAMARAIFKDWFVDFGPVRAKAKGCPPYLSPEIWALFPDALDDDDKPVGWKLKQIEDIAEQCKGSISPSSEPEWLFEHYSLPAFDSGQEPASDLGETIKSNKTLIPKGTVLLSKLNPEISRVWIPNDPQEAPQIASTEFLVFMPKAPVGRGLLYCLFRDSRFKQMLEGMVTGTSKSHQRISPPALLRSSGLCGSLLVFELFEKTISPILLRLLSNRAESQTLAQLRDLLLPKLMSGEICLRDAEKMVEAVA